MCPHCGLPGACPPGTCLVRDSYDLSGLPRAIKPKDTRKMPAAAGKKPVTKTAAAKPTKTAPKSYVKKEIIELWEEAGKADKTLVVKPMPANKRGSSLPFYTIRISGSLPEIKATLGKLKTLLRYDRGKTRLELKLAELTEKEGGPVIKGSWVCYVQIKERA